MVRATIPATEIEGPRHCRDWDVLGIAAERCKLGIEVPSDLGRTDEILVLEAAKPAEAMVNYDAAAHPRAAVLGCQ